MPAQVPGVVAEASLEKGRDKLVADTGGMLQVSAENCCCFQISRGPVGSDVVDWDVRGGDFEVGRGSYLISASQGCSHL